MPAGRCIPRRSPLLCGQRLPSLQQQTDLSLVHTLMHAFTGLPQTQVSKQSQKHAAQLEAFQYAVGSRRPAKPHCSKELLNQRRVIDLLARQGCYSKAAAVQQATNGMEAAEMKATLATFEAEVCLHHHQCACHHHACDHFYAARRA